MLLMLCCHGLHSLPQLLPFCGAVLSPAPKKKGSWQRDMHGVGCMGGIYGVGVQSGLNWAANACA